MSAAGGESPAAGWDEGEESPAPAARGRARGRQAWWMSRSLVSGMKIEPMIAVITETTIGYQRP
jgi:hypothetical protein